MNSSMFALLVLVAAVTLAAPHGPEALWASIGSQQRRALAALRPALAAVADQIRSSHGLRELSDSSVSSGSDSWMQNIPPRCITTLGGIADQLGGLLGSPSGLVTPMCQAFSTFDGNVWGCLNAIIPGIQGLFSGLCGQNNMCAMQFDSLTTCDSEQPPVCTTSSELTPQSMNVVCGSCVTGLAASLITFGQATQQGHGMLPAAVGTQIIAAAQLVSAGTDALCATDSTSGQYCALMFNFSAYTDMATYLNAPGNSLVMLAVSPAEIATTCGSTSAQMCFRKVTVRMMGVFQMMASGGAISDSGLPLPSLPLGAAAQIVGLSQSICSANPAGQNCLALPIQTAQNNAQFKQCLTSVASYVCTPACSQLFNTTFSSWGCCAKVVILSPGGFQACPDFAAVNASLPAACPVPISTLRFWKALTLNAVSYSLVANNASLAAQLTANLVMDLAGQLGVLPNDITSTSLVPAGTALPPQTSGAGRRVAARRRGLAALSGEATQLQFELGAPTNAEAQAASSNFDSSVASGTLTLPMTSTTLANEGIIAPGESATGPTNSPSSPSKLPLIIGAAVGGFVFVALVAVIVVVLVRRSRGRSSYQPLEEHHGFTKGV